MITYPVSPKPCININYNEKQKHLYFNYFNKKIFEMNYILTVEVCLAVASTITGAIDIIPSQFYYF